MLRMVVRGLAVLTALALPALHCSRVCNDRRS